MSDILQQGREIAEKQFAETGFTGKKNAYECDGQPGYGNVPNILGCGSFIITIDRHPGVTPFMVRCGNCNGFAHSKFYRVSDRLEPTHEWYRPETLAGIPKSYHDHLSNGGLILRPIGDNGWQNPNALRDERALNEKLAEMKKLSALETREQAGEMRKVELQKREEPQFQNRQQRRHFERKGRK